MHSFPPPTNLGSRQQPGQQMQRNCYAFNYDGIVTNQTAIVFLAVSTAMVFTN